jgi:hypothetical protein
MRIARLRRALTATTGCCLAVVLLTGCVGCGPVPSVQPASPTAHIGRQRRLTSDETPVGVVRRFYVLRERGETTQALQLFAPGNPVDVGPEPIAHLGAEGECLTFDVLRSRPVGIAEEAGRDDYRRHYSEVWQVVVKYRRVLRDPAPRVSEQTRTVTVGQRSPGDPWRVLRIRAGP